MFDNVGSKVKTLAKVLCWIGIIASVISGLSVWFGGYSNYSSYGGGTFWIGLITVAVGCFASWLGSLATYAIGEAAEFAEMNNAKLNELTEAVKELKQSGLQNTKTSNSSANQTPPAKTYSSNHTGSTWRCPKCGCTNDLTSTYCKDCGTYR